MEPVHDVQAEAHGLQEDAALVDRQQALGRGHAEDEPVGRAPRLLEGVGEVTADRDAVGYAVEDAAGVEAGVSAVDDREDVSYRSEWRTRPLAVLPSPAPKLASQ